MKRFLLIFIVCCFGFFGQSLAQERSDYFSDSAWNILQERSFKQNAEEGNNKMATMALQELLDFQSINDTDRALAYYYLSIFNLPNEKLLVLGSAAHELSNYINYRCHKTKIP